MSALPSLEVIQLPRVGLFAH